MTKRASQRCYNLIKKYESLQLVAYRCPAGVLTIGYGSTLYVSESMNITQKQADDRLLVDVSRVEQRLNQELDGIKFDATQNQFDGLVSLCFNVGANLSVKAPHLWSDLKTGNIQDAANQFLDMDHALVNGHVTELPGLKKRREEERALFLGV